MNVMMTERWSIPAGQRYRSSRTQRHSLCARVEREQQRNWAEVIFLTIVTSNLIDVN
jgi:hypothetical protein